MLNDRPLTYLSSDVSDEEPLTLSHLLSGRRITALPYPVIDKEEINGPDYSSSEQLQRRACQQALLFQTFWHQWKHDYLTYLHEFHQTSGNNQQKIKVGDVVLVHDDSPRRNWKLAVTEDLHKGGDGLVCVADIRNSRGEQTGQLSDCTHLKYLQMMEMFLQLEICRPKAKMINKSNVQFE